MPDLPTKEYDLLDLLDQLEELLEDMDDLGVASRAEAEQFMTLVRARLDERDDKG